MTYKDFFRQSDFDEVWRTLRDVYHENEESRPLYKAVHQSVREMNEDKIHSDLKIEMNRTQSGEVYVKGAPDPQEWLVDREVEKDFEIEDVNEIVGHLLYWSTLYGIKTQKLQSEDFAKWLVYSARGPFYTHPDNDLDNLPHFAFDAMEYEEECERIGRINAESCERKKLRYWKGTILDDEAYSWAWNFIILRKKLEFNIGYYRFTQRYVGWEKDVERMELACRLLDIAQDDNSIYGTDTYVNINNCSRFNIDSAEFEEGSKFADVYKDELRKEKAYQLVWTVLRQNMKKWWD